MSTDPCFVYNSNFKFDDPNLDYAYVANVPCYKLEDLSLLMNGTTSVMIQRLWSEFDHAITITTNNRRGRKSRYMIATPETVKWVAQQFVANSITGKQSKMPTLHKKTVRIIQRGHWQTSAWKFSKPPMRIDLYICDKYKAKWVYDTATK